MSTLLALDPGIRYPACAIFVDGKLVTASRVKLPGKLAKLPMGERVREVSLLIEAWVSGQGFNREQIDDVVLECPQVYRVGKSKGDPNDLIPLALVGGYVAGIYVHASVTSPLPREWLGGNTPKASKGDPWESPRGARAARALSDIERSRIVPSHDALDAACIGLWRLGRFERVRVLPGAV